MLQIPILIIPCKNFVVEKLSELPMELFDHITKCKSCEIVNNNNIFPSKKIIKNILVAKTKEININNGIVSYHNVQEYYDMNFYPHNLLYLIKDKSSLYNNCVFIFWRV